MLIAIIDQEDESCDYSVHCGTLVQYKPDGQDEEDFVNEIFTHYDEYSIKFYRGLKLLRGML